jgi:hypothetical protein
VERGRFDVEIAILLMENKEQTHQNYRNDKNLESERFPMPIEIFLIKNRIPQSYHVNLVIDIASWKANSFVCLPKLCRPKR